MALVLQKAKAGCMGCYYENKDKCPTEKEGSKDRDFSVCSSETEALIFVEVPEEK